MRVSMPASASIRFERSEASGFWGGWVLREQSEHIRANDSELCLRALRASFASESEHQALNGQASRASGEWLLDSGRAGVSMRRMLDRAKRVYQLLGRAGATIE